MNKAPISLCMICKNEQGQLENCLKSIRDHVDEIIIVDTGSTDDSPNIAKRYADKFEVFTDCNDSNGSIIDFSLARQRSFDLASHDWVMWVDADDEVRNADQIPRLIENYGNNPSLVMFPYEYSHDENGNVTCLHWRERMFYPRKNFQWKNPVHEIVDSVDKNHSVHRNENVVIVHRRVESGKVVESGRNLRILKAYYDKHGESDVRQLYYLGLEYGNNGDTGNAIKFHKRYMELSGWDEEKFMSCQKVVEHYQSMGDYETAIEWSLKALTIREGWAEAYFSLARCYYFLGQQGGPQEKRNWEKCVHFAELGLKIPPTQTILFVNPMDRNYDIHRYLNMAYNKLGRVQDALDSAMKGLSVKPSDEALKSNARIYKEFLFKKQIEDGLNGLVAGGFVSQDLKARIIADIEKKEQVISNTKNKLVELNEDLSKIQAQGNDDLDVVMFVGFGPDKWCPTNIPNSGIGGSETMAWEMSRRLVKLGYRVRLFGDCEGMEGEYEGVKFIHYTKFSNVETDIFITSRRPHIVDDDFNIKAKVTLCWVHDVHCGSALNHVRSLKIDRFLCLSNWHKEFFLNTYNFVHPDQVIVTRNGIDLSRFVVPEPSDDLYEAINPHRAVYSSSPDRGLQSALDSWHLVRAKVPDAELHVYYGFDSWISSARLNDDQDQLNLAYSIKNHLDSKAHLGVVSHGRIGQKELAQEFMKSGVWAYPTWFSETSCITAMEAQAAGLRIVTSPIAALNETVGDRGVMIQGDWLSSEYQQKWSDKIVEAMLSSDDDSVRKRNFDYAHSHFGLDDLATEWDTMLRNVLSEVERDVVPFYKAVGE